MTPTSTIMQHFATGELSGPGVQETTRTLGQLDGVFRDRTAWAGMNPATLVYRVRWHQPVVENTEGGLFWGTTIIEPGNVGDEYFQTRGHTHRRADRSEYYITLAGRGALILMSAERQTRVEWMSAGSVHYIPGFTAHRVANVGSEPLRMAACWPSDAGHDYDTIARDGFSGQVCRIGGEARLIFQP